MKHLVQIPPETTKDLKKAAQTGPGYQIVSVELTDGRTFVLAVVSEGQGIKAGFAGGLGAGKILSEQQAANASAVQSAKSESDAKDASVRKQEELNNSLQKGFEILKTGGAAAYALSQARLELTGAEQNGLWQQAAAISIAVARLGKSGSTGSTARCTCKTDSGNLCGNQRIV